MRFDRELPIQSGSPARHPVRVAVLLVNLGTPDAPTPSAVRRYLAEFLSDRRVVEIPPLVWQLILRLFILPLRSRASAKKYASVWLAEGSPLRVHTQHQTEQLRHLLSASGYQVTVEYAMRYGTPSIAAVLRQFKHAGIDKVLLVPMYPQYAASTTATAFDAAFDALKRMRNQPALRLVKEYCSDPRYIHALAEQVRTYWVRHGRPDFAGGDRLLLSFHGIPKRSLDLGDPYHEQCQATGALLRSALELSADECRVTFQSRFGAAEWLQPYTAPTLTELGAAGIRRVDVFCPGFTADCLETVEEIGMEGRDVFLAAGGQDFHAIPCLNAAPAWIQGLGEIVAANLQGWPVQGMQAVGAAA